MKLRRSMLWLVVCGLVLMPVAAAVASEEKSPRDLIEAYRIWKLTEVLDLSEEQMPLFFAKLRSIEESEAVLREEEHKAVREIASLLERKEVGDGQLERALARLEEMRTKHFDEVRKLRRDAASMLSVRQRCQFVVFEERFRSELREMIGRVREMRGGRSMEDGGELRGLRGLQDPGGRGETGYPGEGPRRSGGKTH